MRYSQLYIQVDGLAQDSLRARNRIASLLNTIDAGEGLGLVVEAELGVRIPPNHGRYWLEWDKFVTNPATPVRDLLDMITVIYNVLRTGGSKVGSDRARLWLDGAREIFAQEHLAYAVDDNAVVHPAVDREFQRNRTSVVAGLQLPRYSNVLQSFARVSDELSADPPHGKEAWRACFSAAEGLFRLMFPGSPRLTSAEIETRLRPVLQRVYAADATGLRAAEKLAASFRDWVDASHNYRHEPGSEEPAEPPLAVAILAISNGASFLRWLVDLDQQTQ
jgi:hypothetical protein